MTSPELDNLVRIGKLKRELASDEEIAGLLQSAEDRLNDAGRPELSYSSKFDLAYNAAHAMALAALRRAGYRSDNRYLVFQALAHTVGLATEKVARAGEGARAARNLAEYEGHLERDDQLLAELIATANELRKAVGSLPRPLAPGTRS